MAEDDWNWELPKRADRTPDDGPGPRRARRAAEPQDDDTLGGREQPTGNPGRADDSGFAGYPGLNDNRGFASNPGLANNAGLPDNEGLPDNASPVAHEGFPMSGPYGSDDVPDSPWLRATDSRATNAYDTDPANADQPYTDEPSSDPQRDKPARTQNSGFGRSVLFTVLGAFIPGVGLIAARKRGSGGFILGIFVALVVGGLVWALTDTHSLVAAAVDPTLLRKITVGLIILGAVWVLVIIASHLSLTRGRLRRGQRAAAALLVGVLSFVIAAPVAVGARYSYDQAGLVSTVFHQQGTTKSATLPKVEPTAAAGKDPWANKPRVNILLLGSDAGPDRTGTRTDTVIVASIDTHTGDTTLISLPRNTADMPFPPNSPLAKYYPNGFQDAQGNGNDAEYFLNAEYDNIPANVPKNILGKTDNLGADVMKLSVGQAIGLKIDYYVLINLAGFQKLINALGGITVNINTYVAMGGDVDENRPPKTWLAPGPNQHLDGNKALWFARGRYGADDFQRMDRQRCVINAMIQQASPANVLTRYEAIAKAGKDIIKTDIPQEALPAFVDLSMRAKKGNFRSIVFTQDVNGFISPDPNFNLVREQVAQTIQKTVNPPKKKTSKKHSKSGSSSSTTTPSTSETGSSGTPVSETGADACAYDPQEAAQAKANPPF